MKTVQGGGGGGGINTLSKSAFLTTKNLLLAKELSPELKLLKKIKYMYAYCQSIIPLFKLNSQRHNSLHAC